MINSIDRDGTKAGYDLEITRRISESVSIPVVASGGAGEPEHLRDAFTAGMADAAIVASIVHYGEYPIPELKRYLKGAGVEVRDAIQLTEVDSDMKIAIVVSDFNYDVTALMVERARRHAESLGARSRAWCTSRACSTWRPRESAHPAQRYRRHRADGRGDQGRDPARRSHRACDARAGSELAIKFDKPVGLGSPARDDR